MAKTNVNIPENESKNEKFIRVASPALTVSLTSWIF